eukprot:CAMPEP_0181305632 /NCGR_PEP_ID=MMETSP1101-20121128/9842_1 /TAXON_ID=46948 /ORGANISM="Rhodomonas abbreviata, Strain Caron Lab Isolate" /LENGTH=779 /DNA_ID=CAMNT_0023411579 /DNA_START=176 /DNA_END=2515 /DNA_ORIENTATION=+
MFPAQGYPQAPAMQAPGMMQPGMMQPGMMQPGMMQPGMMQPGMMQPNKQGANPPVAAPAAKGAPADGPSWMKVKGEMSAYAAELVCEEPDTRHWVHRWCLDPKGGNGQLAKTPKILQGTGLECTIPNCMSVSAKKNGNSPCMGARQITECVVDGKKQYWMKGDFVWRNYNTVFQDIQAAASGLLQLPGVSEKRAAKKQVVAALLAETSQEWMIAAQAAMACGITVTTVYATLGHDAMCHGIKETEAEIIFVDWGLFESIKTDVLAACTSLKHIVFIGKDFVPKTTVGGKAMDAFPTPETARGISASQATCYTLDGRIAAGKAAPKDLTGVAPREQDIAMIMYTSGSTGTPKGVVLTHLNFVSVVASATAQGTILPTPQDVVIAYLPLAHIFELLVEVVVLSQGGCLGYAHPRTLTASSPYIKTNNQVPCPGYVPDLNALRPTLMAAVPAVLDAIAGGLKRKMTIGLKGKLLSGAVARRMGKPAGCGICACLDNTIIKKVGLAIGLDRVRLLISGGAPLAKDTQEFVQALFAPIAQGYGATETAACATVQECFSVDGRPEDRNGGRVGAIQPASEIKLKSVPDMGYLVTDNPPRGEILISGNNVTQIGYYKMEKKSMEDFPMHPNGRKYFHTGDIGVVDPDGVLRIIDRKKDLIKLQGGEYVSLGKVEATLKQVPGIAACCVFARPDKDHCVVIVSQPEKGWASVGGKPEQGPLLAAIASKLKEVGLARFEIPTKVAIDDEIWTPESGLVTASMKVQRNPLRDHYNKPGGLLSQMDYNFA